ncbi:Uncharacterized membrane protein [Sphingomonas guangdongensis]|uniref:Uncharacterized membrane protein n=1 Tax=Sphingomonas guangdongensis TaxID=1141890 RepID=A0A285QEN3_9SPHN|nr:hypothetical protein [Sphingomonas guangdongensis]SOB79978.1 Uncharacterized membrane protein [Sphingomonas guangdongensis]
MATLAEPTIAPARRVSLAPDRFERLLGIGAGVLLVFVLAALLRGRAEWGQVPAAIWPHIATIVVALVLTVPLMLRRRGDRSHRVLGTVWVAAMIATALLSFRIHTVNGSWSWIHLLSLWTLVQVPLLWWHARRHNVAGHRAAVRGMVTGALLIAGFFTFPFNRLLGHWLFG